MAWVTPVYDRVSSDVTNRRPKGYLNYEDLNRIEGNIEFIRDNMEDLKIIWFDVLYGNTKIDWFRTDFIYLSDLEKILENVKTIEDYFYSAYQELPTDMNNPNYIKMNQIEKALLEIKNMLNSKIEEFKYSGTFNSDQRVVL